MAEKKIKVMLVKGCIVNKQRGIPGKIYTVEKHAADLLIGAKQAVDASDEAAVKEGKALVEKQKKREESAKAAQEELDAPKE